MKMSLNKKQLIIFIISTLINFSIFSATYVVEKGDTLYSISKKFSVSVAELRNKNNLSENDVIKIGQKLIIPSKNEETNKQKESVKSEKTTLTNNSTKKDTDTYTVQKGDTLYGISKKFGMDVQSLMQLNNLSSSDVIKIGQNLRVNKNNTQQVKQINTNTKNNDNQDLKIDFGNIPDIRNYGVTVESDNSTIWPVKNPKVTTVKGKVGGVQLSAQYNEPVTCVREGTVMYVGTYRGFGQFIFVQSKTGVIYAYSGLSSVNVKKSDYVLFGSELGTAGVDSMSGKPAIQFMVFQNGKPIDPSKAPRN